MLKYLFHFCALLLILSNINCKTYVEANKPNQREPFPSPSGKYILRVPIEADPTNQHHYWRVTITDNQGTVLFKDDSAFVGYLNVYWYWDQDDRVWLINSDDGSVYYWQLDGNGGWKRYEWKESNKELPIPPAELFPPWYNK
jgi:hypothetical protein